MNNPMFGGNLGAIALYGSQVVIYALVSLSVLSIGAIIERAVWFARRRVDIELVTKDLLARLANDDVAGARAALLTQRSVECQAIASALEWYDGGPDALAEGLQASVRAQRPELYAGLTFLGTLGNNAPFIGLLGTVLGVITAFQQLGADAVGSMGNVMSGIAEALVATAVGIVVALPAVAAHNAFQQRAVDVEENIARIGHLLAAQLERQRARGGK